MNMDGHLPLEEANRHMRDGHRLKEILQEKGYLFFRGLLDPQKISKVKLDIMRVLSRYDIVKRGESEPIWTGKSYSNEDAQADSLNRILNLKSFRDLPNSREMMTILERILGGPVYVWVNKIARPILPVKEVRAPYPIAAPIHRDAIFFTGSPVFYTAWVPLMNFDEALGGLAVAAGSHKMPHNEDDYIYTGKTAGPPGIPEGRYHLNWHWSEYHPGDVVIFPNLTLHKGLPNRSRNLIRLSADYRLQLKGTKTDWTVRRRHDWRIRYYKKITGIAAEAGADVVLQDKVFRRIAETPQEVTIDTVRKVMQEIRASS